MRWLLSLTLTLVLGCGTNPCSTNAHQAIDSGTIVPTDVTAQYEPDVRAFAAHEGLSADWVQFLLDHRADYIGPYGLARISLNAKQPAKVLTVFVDYYQSSITYNPAWESEAHHQDELMQLLSLQYPGWTFLRTTSREANVTMNLGQADPTSRAVPTFGISPTGTHFIGDTYLHYETIAGHELAHLFGLPHHGPDFGGDLALDPPGEGPCIMSRDARYFGPTERFLLGLDNTTSQDTAIKAQISSLMAHYPKDF